MGEVVFDHQLPLSLGIYFNPRYYHNLSPQFLTKLFNIFVILILSSSFLHTSGRHLP